MPSVAQSNSAQPAIKIRRPGAPPISERATVKIRVSGHG
jgi:hypothetical protein